MFKRFLKWPWEVWTALNSPVCEWRHGRLGLDALTRPWPGQGYTNTKTGWAEIQVSTNTNTNTDSRICKALTWPRLCKYKYRNQKYKYPLIRKQTTKSSARQSTTWPRLHKHKDRMIRNTNQKYKSCKYYIGAEECGKSNLLPINFRLSLQKRKQRCK